MYFFQQSDICGLAEDRGAWAGTAASGTVARSPGSWRWFVCPGPPGNRPSSWKFHDLLLLWAFSSVVRALVWTFWVAHPAPSVETPGPGTQGLQRGEQEPCWPGGTRASTLCPVLAAVQGLQGLGEEQGRRHVRPVQRPRVRGPTASRVLGTVTLAPRCWCAGTRWPLEGPRGPTLRGGRREGHSGDLSRPSPELPAGTVSTTRSHSGHLPLRRDADAHTQLQKHFVRKVKGENIFILQRVHVPLRKNLNSADAALK